MAQRTVFRPATGKRPDLVRERRAEPDPRENQAMPEAEAFNNIATIEIDDPDYIIGELRAGVGVLLHLAGSGNTVEPEEISFIAEKLSQLVDRLETASYSEEKQRPAAGPAPPSDAAGEAQGEFVRSILDLTSRWAKRFDRKDIAAWESAFAQIAQVMVEKLKRSEPQS